MGCFERIFFTTLPRRRLTGEPELTHSIQARRKRVRLRLHKQMEGIVLQMHGAHLSEISIRYVQIQSQARD